MVRISLTLITFASLCCGQSEWQQFQKTDALSGVTFSDFMLTGKFVTPPGSPSLDAPALFVRCFPGKRGKFVSGHVAVGAPVHSVVTEKIGGGTDMVTGVQYRLNDGKIQAELWSVGPDGTAVFFSSLIFNNLLYGHLLKHKENTSPPTRKIVIGIGGILDGEIVMQFDMPDPTRVADACGVNRHKR
jgi:hypothetical protein